MAVEPQFLAADLTQTIIATGSAVSALIALALALGFREWMTRPQVRLLLRHAADPEEISDRVVTKRLEDGAEAAFVRLRVDNRGRSTARNVAVAVLKVHRWDPERGEWIRLRPELDGRLLQPSNHVSSGPVLLDVFPHSDRIVDLASVDRARAANGAGRMFVEISRPWPHDELNALEPGTWRLELLVAGDNIRAERSFIALMFDGTWPATQEGIWDHFLIHGPIPEMAAPPPEARMPVMAEPDPA